jgi:N-carbamoylputrescine amidase
MSRIVRCSLIQATNAAPPDASLQATKKAMIDKHVTYIEQAAKAGAQIVCLQEIFYGPYFCAEQTPMVRFHRADPRLGPPSA